VRAVSPLREREVPGRYGNAGPERRVDTRMMACTAMATLRLPGEDGSDIVWRGQDLGGPRPASRVGVLWHALCTGLMCVSPWNCRFPASACKAGVVR
jgi:hypothetical protein